MKKLFTFFVLLTGALFTTQAQNNALNFDGQNDNIEIANNPSINLTDNYTIEAWIKVNSFKWLSGIVSKYQSEGSNGYVLRLSGSGNYRGISFNEMETADNLLVSNQWYHIAAVSDAGTLHLYIDGVEQTLNGTALTVAENNDPVKIGTDFNERYFDGNIDEVKIWKVARNQSEVIADQNAILNPTSEVNLVTYFQFNEGVAYSDNTSINSISDVSSSALVATPNNFNFSGSNSNYVAFNPGNQAVSTLNAVVLNSFNATIQNEITAVGSDPIQERGVCLDESPYPSINSFYISESGTFTTGTFSINLTNLSSNNTYYARAFVKTSIGEITYGEVISFTTPFFSTTYYPTGSKDYPTWFYENVAENYGHFYNPNTSKSGSALNDATLHYETYSRGDAYDGAFEFFVGVGDSVYTDSGSPITSGPLLIMRGAPSLKGASLNVLDTIGTTIYLPEQKIDELYLSKSYYFSTTQPVVRAIYKIRNATSQEREIKIGTYTNLGSDKWTMLEGSSTGNATLSDADRWMITTDGNYYGDSDPINTWVRFGPGTVKSKPIFGKKPESGHDEYLDTIPVTIPANDYVLIMQFNRMDSTVTAAQDNALLFNSETDIYQEGYFDGLTNDDLIRVVNWDLSSISIPSSSDNIKTDSGVEIYPNPTNNGFYVESSDQNSTLILSDIQGNVIITQAVSGKSYIDIANLSQGIYIVKINGYQTKLIKK